MPHEGTGKESNANLRHGVIAELPVAAVERVHVGPAAGHHAHRHATRDHLAVRCHIGTDPIHLLRSTQVRPETGHYFVEDQGRAGLFCNRADFLQEFLRPQLRVAALDRLDQDCRYLIRTAADHFKRCRGAVFKHQHVRDTLVRNARRCRNTLLAPVRLHQHFVNLAVVGTGEQHDQVLACDRPGKTHRRHHRFRTRVAERDALHADQRRHQFSTFTGEFRLGSNGKTELQLVAHSFGNKIRRVAKENGAEAVQDVDVFVAIEVP